MPVDVENDIVQVLYDFDYVTEEGRSVSMKEGEELLLIKKTNIDWWQVIRDGERRPFYAPASYIKESDVNANIQKKSSNHETVLYVSNPLYSEVRPTKQPDPAPKENGLTPENGTSTETEESSSAVTVIHVTGLSFCNPLCPADDNDQQPDRQSDEDEDSCLDSNDDDGTKSTDSAYNERLQKVLSDLDENSSLEHSKSDDKLSQESKSPIYANFPLLSSPTPPIPQTNDQTAKELFSNWYEYTDNSGRKYYYNSLTKETTWKPPRKITDEFPSKEGSPCSVQDDAPPTPPRKPKPKLVKSPQVGSSSESLDDTPTKAEDISPSLPQGWNQAVDDETNELYYTHTTLKEKWFCSLDEYGRVYYYAENSSESFWELPTQVSAQSTEGKLHVALPNSHSEPDGWRRRPPRPLDFGEFRTKHCSMFLDETLPAESDPRSSSLPRGLAGPQWPRLLNDGNVKVTRQGVLNKAKLLENGKRLKKHWSPSVVMLTDLLLLLYKDLKASQMGSAKPEMCFDLAGALVEWAPKMSSRKNVLQLRTIPEMGNEILLQDDNASNIKTWFHAIHATILKLPTKHDWNKGKDELTVGKPKVRKGSRLARSKSQKPEYRGRSEGSAGKTTDSAEDLANASPTERKQRIRDKLLNFFLRRPSMESLREKGIIKDEPVFGCQLSTLCSREKSSIPRFVKLCIEAIEKTDMKADGLYRASGNLSQVQKIRFQVNQDDYSGLKIEEDVHVLTGALKMFFRDMKEPLLPFRTFSSFLGAISLNDKSSKVRVFHDLVRTLPKPNYDTLRFLMEHLIRLTKLSDHNRMHVQNIAIVYGPTLMWPETESSNLALDMMHQNQIIEFFLLEYPTIFSWKGATFPVLPFSIEQL